MGVSGVAARTVIDPEALLGKVEARLAALARSRRQRAVDEPCGALVAPMRATHRRGGRRVHVDWLAAIRRVQVSLERLVARRGLGRFAAHARLALGQRAVREGAQQRAGRLAAMARRAVHAPRERERAHTLANELSSQVVQRGGRVGEDEVLVVIDRDDERAARHRAQSRQLPRHGRAAAEVVHEHHRSQLGADELGVVRDETRGHVRRERRARGIRALPAAIVHEHGTVDAEQQVVLQKADEVWYSRVLEERDEHDGRMSRRII